MKGKWKFLLLMSLFSCPAFSLTLSEVDFELKKISEYRSQGIFTAANKARESELLELRKKLIRENERNENLESSKKELNANKKSNPQDYLNFVRNIQDDQEKFAVIINKLEEERHSLGVEIEKANRNEKIISQIRDRIDLLEWKKTIVQKRIVNSAVESKIATYRVSGLLDMYYGLSSNHGGNNGSTDRTTYHNTLRYYDNKHNDFTINLAEITLSGGVQKTSFLLDLDFGDFAEQNAGSNEVTKHIGQGNVTYDFDGKHSITVGKMYSHVGYELAKPIENWNYSRPFAFGFGIPFWHEGVALKGNYSSGFRWGLFAYDKTDSHIANSQDKSYGVQLGFVNDKKAFLYNGISGPDQNGKEGRKRTVHNINGQYNSSSNLSFAFDWVLGSDDNATGVGNKDQKWQSLVGYVNWKFKDDWRFAARSEWFAETTNAGPDGTYRLGVDGSVHGPVDITTRTLTLARTLTTSNELRLEYRLDHANNPIFWDRNNQLKKDQDTIVIAWMLKI